MPIGSRIPLATGSTASGGGSPVMADAAGEGGAPVGDGAADEEAELPDGDDGEVGLGDGVAHAASRPTIARAGSPAWSGFIGLIVSRSCRVARQP